jgi:hypothetical protein
LALIVACNASLQLQEQASPLPETEEQAEGTAAHLVATGHAAGLASEWPLGRKFESGGHTWEVDFDMHNGARLYADTLYAGSSAMPPRLEDSVKCARIHETECAGTCDGWRYFPNGTGPNLIPVIRVVEYKYGHKFVEVFECWQLLAYCVGIMDMLNLSDENLIIEFVLVQPRSFTREGQVRTWRVPANELRGLINIANHAAHVALMPDPVAVTGTHCIDCNARHVCGTFQRSVGSIVDYSMKGEFSPLTPQALGHELRILDAALARLEARRTGLAIEAEQMIRNSQPVAFYEMAPGMSKMVYLDNASPAEIAAVGDMLNINLRKPLAVCTPKQAIDAGVSADIIAQYAHRPPGALKLKATSTKAADKAFGVIAP